MPCHAVLCHRSVGGQRDSHPANASPVQPGLNRRSWHRCWWVLGGSALPSLPLARERPFASQVPGVASLSGIKQTLLRSGARCCPCAHGTSPSLPRAPPCLLPFPHAGKSMCPWGEEPLKYWTQAPLALVVQEPLASLHKAGSSSKAEHRVGPSLPLLGAPPNQNGTYT